MSEYSWKEIFLAITPKPFAIISLCGSTYIIKHVLTSPKRRGEVFHRILLGLSIWDFMTSIAVFLGTWPIPIDTPGVFMASGTAATCTAQGFWMQLGVGAPLYNASLSIYYFLVIFKGWKECQLKKIEPFFHGIPILFSLSTAIAVAATDSYRSSNVWCWISSDRSVFRFCFFYGPVWFALTIVTVAMIAIYGRVLVQERKTKQYREPEQSINQRKPTISNLEKKNSTISLSIRSSKRSSASRSSGQSRQIASQAMFYVGSFYLTFAFPSWTRIYQLTMNKQPPFAVIALFAIFFPLQGFFNALVYFRPRYLRYRKENPDVKICLLLSEMWQNHVPICTDAAASPAGEEAC